MPTRSIHGVDWPTKAAPNAYLRTNVIAKAMENAIVQWEADIEYYESATEETFPNQFRRKNLEEMCPDRFKTRVSDMGPERLPEIEQILLEISDWLATEAGPGSKSQASGAVGGASKTLLEDEQYEESRFYYHEWDCWLNGLAHKRARTDDGDGDAVMTPSSPVESGGRKG